MIELDSEERGVKFDRRDINSLRYVDDTILLAESSNGLKCLQMKVKKESSKAGLHLNKITKIISVEEITQLQHRQ